jgi:hypothetical protein
MIKNHMKWLIKRNLQMLKIFVSTEEGLPRLPDILFLTPEPTELSRYSYYLYELCHLNVT